MLKRATQLVTPLNAAIFDCDGLLIDSEQPWLELVAGYLASFGLDRELADQARGASVPDAVELLGSARAWAADRDGYVPGAPELPPAPTADEIDLAYSTSLADLAAPMPGAHELLGSLFGRVPIAVASNGHKRDVIGLLERAELLDFVDAVVTIEDVEHGKPDPAPYLLAARWLGVAPRRAVAFEDSFTGTVAAAAAGCTVVGVNADERVELRADIRVRRLSELELDPVAGGLRRADSRDEKLQRQLACV